MIWRLALVEQRWAIDTCAAIHDKLDVLSLHMEFALCEQGRGNVAGSSHQTCAHTNTQCSRTNHVTWASHADGNLTVCTLMSTRFPPEVSCPVPPVATFENKYQGSIPTFNLEVLSSFLTLFIISALSQFLFWNFTQGWSIQEDVLVEGSIKWYQYSWFVVVPTNQVQ